ncbi:MAG: ribbon-helix-helix protein, CopG family [Gammaproteobacteria bacterium]|nr:MAG: ribbon-helix-helix protein, CopG family [Gammaproteobacteria bacterium]
MQHAAPRPTANQVAYAGVPWSSAQHQCERGRSSAGPRCASCRRRLPARRFCVRGDPSQREWGEIGTIHSLVYVVVYVWRPDYSVRGTRLRWRSPVSAKAEDLLRQQYLVPRKSVKKLREMSRREGVSAGELARRAIEAYTSGKVLTESEEEAAARALLEDIHGQVRATLKRIDASVIEVRARERALADGSFRAQVRKETQAWFEAHPHQARAIAELFTQDPGA